VDELPPTTAEKSGFFSSGCVIWSLLASIHRTTNPTAGFLAPMD